jgi:hypothetical protein
MIVFLKKRDVKLLLTLFYIDWFCVSSSARPRRTSSNTYRKDVKLYKKNVSKKEAQAKDQTSIGGFLPTL